MRLLSWYVDKSFSNDYLLDGLLILVSSNSCYSFIRPMPVEV